MRWTATGKNGQVFFDGQVITIVRTASLGTFLNQGVQGERSIIAKHVTAIEFRVASRGSAGFISFDYAGKKSPRGGIFDAASDESAVIFGLKNNVEFTAIKDAVMHFLTCGKNAVEVPFTQANSPKLTASR